MKRLLTIIIVCIGFAGIGNLSAATKSFTVIIKGTAPASPGFILTLNDVSNSKNIPLAIDKNGRFEYRTELKYPSQFHITYGEHMDDMFFVFGPGTVELSIASDTAEVKELRGISARANAFAAAEVNLFGEYLGWIRSSKNYDSVLDRIAAAIKALPDIGNDDYTNVLAESAKLNIRNLLVYQTHIKPDEASFKKLPWQDPRFEGFELYTFLMWPAWKTRLEKEIKAAHKDSTYTPSLEEIITKMDEQKTRVLSSTYINARYAALGMESNFKSESEKAFWAKEAMKFCKDYPENAFTPVLKGRYDLLMNSEIGKEAPQFTLKDTAGKDVSFSSFKGKYILLDVWGSWCFPCRQVNKELVRLYELYKSKDIVFLSIANDADNSVWMKAIHTDKLHWVQLLANKHFLEDYKIDKYPTQFLISPDQKILKRDNIIESDLQNLEAVKAQAGVK